MRAMPSKGPTWGDLQHPEDALHERHLLCVKGIGCMLGMAAILVAGLTAVHHLHANTTVPMSLLLFAVSSLTPQKVMRQC